MLLRRGVGLTRVCSTKLFTGDLALTGDTAGLIGYIAFIGDVAFIGEVALTGDLDFNGERRVFEGLPAASSSDSP